MKATPLTLFFVFLLISSDSIAQIFFTEKLNMTLCPSPGDLQCSFAEKISLVEHGDGYTVNHAQKTTSDFRLFNQYADIGLGISRHFMGLVSYMHENQDGNIYKFDKVDNGLGDRGRYEGSRLSIGGVYILPVRRQHFVSVRGSVYLGGQKRTPNTDDPSSNRFKTNFAGFDLYPVYGVKTNSIDFNFGPRLNYQQYFNGHAIDSGTVAHSDLWAAGVVMDVAVGYRFLKFNMQTGCMGRLSHEEYYQGKRVVESVGFYTTMGVTAYIGRYYRQLPVSPR